MAERTGEGGAQRRANARLGWILAGVVLAFFCAIILYGWKG
jgi:hypothetical protein